MSALRRTARSGGHSLPAKPFDVPHARVSRSLVGLAAVVVLLAGAAVLAQMRLTEQQISGTQRVLASLDAEALELDKHWAEGAVPAKMLAAERDHIDDEKAQQQAQLAQLKASAEHG